MGWAIVHEEQEDGVSGHKVRAENRDRLQIIKGHARPGKFDILLLFMFDRIGRIADEPLFVVERFVKNGVQVWSTQEGEQRFDKSQIVNARYRDKMEERKLLLQSIRAEHAKAAAELDLLKAEIIQVLRGESTFSKELLSSMVSEAESKIAALQEQLTAAQIADDEGQTVLNALNAQHEDIISWADIYDQANQEAKKMIVNCLIKRVGSLSGLQTAYRLQYRPGAVQSQNGCDSCSIKQKSHFRRSEISVSLSK